MNADDPNVRMVEIVVEALGRLAEELVFVGGCAAGMLLTDPGRAPIRATNDVDLVAEVTTKPDYYSLCRKLKALGFTEVSEVICRWQIKNVKIDVMPTDKNVLGFSNPWFTACVRTSAFVTLPSGRAIRMISAPLFIATKIVAFQDRGGGDFQRSHDVEDIIALVDGRMELIDEIDAAETSVRDFLEDEIGAMLGDRRFIESIIGHLHPDSASQARVPKIVSRLRKIAGL
jgi:predicted nucleotidyltransferase